MDFMTGDVITLRCGTVCIAVARNGYDFFVSTKEIVTYFHDYEGYRAKESFMYDIVLHERVGFVLYKEANNVPTIDTPKGTFVIVKNKGDNGNEFCSGDFFGISNEGKYQTLECWGDGICKITEWDIAQIV